MRHAFQQWVYHPLMLCFIGRIGLQFANQNVGASKIPLQMIYLLQFWRSVAEQILILLNFTTLRTAVWILWSKQFEYLIENYNVCNFFKLSEDKVSSLELFLHVVLYFCFLILLPIFVQFLSLNFYDLVPFSALSSNDYTASAFVTHFRH